METIQPLYDKQLKCLVCEHSFTSKKIRSRFVKVTAYDTDFCPSYNDEESNALYYNIHVCPCCGFSSSDDFSKYFPPLTKEEIQTKISAHWVPHHFGDKRTIHDAISTYKLAGYSAILKKEKHITIAGIFLRLAWLFRGNKNHEQEIRFLKIARQEYIESYSTDDFKGTQVSEIRILYLIGELSRRISDVQTAVKYFSIVIEQQSRAVETTIIDMARERWQEIREQRDNNQDHELVNS